MRITLRFDEQLVRHAREWAESWGTTVNDVIRERLRKIARGEVVPYATQTKIPAKDPNPSLTSYPAKRPRTRGPKSKS